MTDIFDEGSRPNVVRVSIEELVTGMGKSAVYHAEQCNKYYDMMMDIDAFLKRTDLKIRGYAQADLINRISWFYEIRTYEGQQ
jgi:plasmid replication initiation protein